MENGSSGIKSIVKQAWGIAPNGQEADLYTLTNKNGLQLKASSYGGIITSIRVPDREGIFGEIVLGFDHAGAYSPAPAFPYFGALVGRYANRIEAASFELDGITYTLLANDGRNSLHGGAKGFDKATWEVEEVRGEDYVGLILRYLSKDGEEGFPGNLSVQVAYRLFDDNKLVIDYFAVTDKPTVLNLTNHSYFNLSAGKAENIKGHELRLYASRYIPVDDSCIPTGEILSVAGSPFDFREPRAVGVGMEELPAGYDHNFVLDNEYAIRSIPPAEASDHSAWKGPKKPLRKAATVYEPLTGRVMEIMCSQPGIQFYTGNYLRGGLTGSGGRQFNKHYGMTFETQHFPDSPNQASFPSVVLREKQFYHEQTVYTFSTR